MRPTRIAIGGKLSRLCRTGVPNATKTVTKCINHHQLPARLMTAVSEMREANRMMSANTPLAIAEMLCCSTL